MSANRYAAVYQMTGFFRRYSILRSSSPRRIERSRCGPGEHTGSSACTPKIIWPARGPVQRSAHEALTRGIAGRVKLAHLRYYFERRCSPPVGTGLTRFFCSVASSGPYLAMRPKLFRPAWARPTASSEAGQYGRQRPARASPPRFRRRARLSAGVRPQRRIRSPNCWRGNPGDATRLTQPPKPPRAAWLPGQARRGGVRNGAGAARA
jgi:hypothetical protein